MALHGGCKLATQSALTLKNGASPRRRVCTCALILAAAATVFCGSPTLARTADQVALPWSAAVAPPEKIEVAFNNAGAQLRGTLILPPGQARSPVVVVYHSASDALEAAPLYRHLVEMLPTLGIGVFTFDRRGSGRSSGPSAAGSFVTLADDGIAARRALAALPGVDPRAIGYWGLSQGGWLAALAAQRDPDCAFAISVSAPMVTADVQMRFAVANILRIRGFDQEAIDQAVGARLAVDDFMRGRIDRESAQRIVTTASAQPWFRFTYMGPTFADPASSNWAREIANDPLKALRDTNKPVLVIYGSTDPWVPVSISVERIQDLMRTRRNVELRIIAGADHAMMSSATPLEQVDPERTASQAPEAPEYFGVMAQWLTANGFAKSSRE